MSAKGRLPVPRDAVPCSRLRLRSVYAPLICVTPGPRTCIFICVFVQKTVPVELYRRLSDYPMPHPVSASDDLGGESVSGRTGASGHFVALSRALGFRHRKRRLPDLGASKPDPASDGKMNLESAHTWTRTRIIRTYAVADPPKARRLRRVRSRPRFPGRCVFRILCH